MSFGQSAGPQSSAADVQTLFTKKGSLVLSNIQQTIGEIRVKDSVHDVADEIDAVVERKNTGWRIVLYHRAPINI